MKMGNDEQKQKENKDDGTQKVFFLLKDFYLTNTILG